MILCAAALVAAVLTTAAILQHQQIALSQKMIRLHVVANSDTAEDQALKLKVRDAILEVTQTIPDREQLPQALEQLQQAAQCCLLENGCKDAVSVTLGKERFPTRMYDNFALPAGVYTALRVTIGEGKGHNWWCVAFPSICFRATADDLEEAAVSAGFTRQEVMFITQEREEYELKFKLVEWIEAAKEWAFS